MTQHPNPKSQKDDWMELPSPSHFLFKPSQLSAPYWIPTRPVSGWDWVSRIRSYYIGQPCVKKGARCRSFIFVPTVSRSHESSKTGWSTCLSTSFVPVASPVCSVQSPEVLDRQYWPHLLLHDLLLRRSTGRPAEDGEAPLRADRWTGGPVDAVTEGMVTGGC